MKESGEIASELEDFVIEFDEHLEESNGHWPEDLTEPLQILERLKQILGWKENAV